MNYTAKIASALASFLLWTSLAPAFGAEPEATRRPASTSVLEQTRGRAAVLRVFRPVSDLTRASVVRLEVDETPVALGAIVATNGLVLTKASEVISRALTCTLSDGRRVSARTLAIDDDTDLALVQIDADHLQPIAWDTGDVTVGQWAITPGIDYNPEAVGIISVPARRILPKRALLGVQLDYSNTSAAKIARILPGMGAEQAGLQPGDTVLTVNHAFISSSEDLVNTLRTYREGQTVKIHVRRGAKEFDADIELQVLKPTGQSLRFNRQERMNRFGTELSRRAEGFESAVQHDSVLQPDQCGGPLVNLDGRAIGLNIARAGRIASYALPASIVYHTLEQLKREIAAPPKDPELHDTALPQRTEG